MRDTCADIDVDAEAYDDTCRTHPNGCHVQRMAPGVEFHPHPAFKSAPAPGALEAEAFERDIEESDRRLVQLRANRLTAHNNAYRDG